MGCGGSKSTRSASALGESTENASKQEEPKRNDTDTNQTQKEAKKTEVEKTSSENEKTCKIVLVGDERVGKTCICTRFVRDEFIDMYLPTLGSESKSKSLTIGRKNVMLQILDTSGNERFRQPTTTSLNDADGVIMVFDLTNRASLNNMGFWHKLVLSQAPSHCVVALAGNKSDDAEREVTDEDAQAVAKILGTDFVETSAKDSVNLETLFMNVGAKLYG